MSLNATVNNVTMGTVVNKNDVKDVRAEVMLELLLREVTHWESMLHSSITSARIEQKFGRK